MATEQRLIDASAAADGIIAQLDIEWGYDGIREDVQRIFDSIPVVDAVEVVRCKDCKNYVKISEQDKEFRCNVFCGCYDRPYPTGPNDFCSYGERRTT